MYQTIELHKSKPNIGAEILDIDLSRVRQEARKE
jgi:hypothetical protein